MDGDQVIFTIVCCILLVFIIRHINKWSNNLWYAVIFTTGSFVLLASHFWHVIWGEELASETCSVPSSQWAAWTSCPLTFNNIIDSYEITVSSEVIIIESLFIAFVVLYASKPLKPWAVVLVAYSVVELSSAIMLFILPLDYLRDYVDYFNIFGILFTSQKLIVLITRTREKTSGVQELEANVQKPSDNAYRNMRYL